MAPNFVDWFEQITGNKPYPYQERLATVEHWPIVIDIPTGLGKTAAIVLAWLWSRICSQDKKLRQSTPRRLVYILPMRTLVEQIHGDIEQWLVAARLEQPVAVHKLMGGAVSNDWDRDPSQDCIIVGTQDQILSRMLNRGYSMSKYKWPIHFSLLNQDCLFVVDETQLMGAGLRTSAQLQGLRQLWQTYGKTATVWMSATLDADLLTTPDYHPSFEASSNWIKLDAADKANGQVSQRLNAQKKLQKFPISCPVKEKKGKERDEYLEILVGQIDALYKNQVSPGLILVICNRVQRAQKLYHELQGKAEHLLLVHSRFRAGDRQKLNAKLQDFKNDKSRSGIVIATPAIEAGVDISARYLFTELCSWFSFVQRAGRCNRTGSDNENAIVFWMDFEELSKEVAFPYEVKELEQTRKLLAQLEQVGPQQLSNFWDGLPTEQRPQAAVNGLIPRQHDLLQLFDTSADLAGHDLDISPFIRDAENMDVAIAWRKWEGTEPPANSPALQREELCQVSIGAAKNFLKKAEGFIFDQLLGSWVAVNSQNIYPGQSILVSCQAGGYLELVGFTGDTRHQPAMWLIEAKAAAENDGDDKFSKGSQKFISLQQHSEEIVQELRKMLKNLREQSDTNLPQDRLERAARWHDAGKAHPEFQKMMTGGDEQKQQENIWAKSPSKDQAQQLKYRYPADRRGFRHELASALWALQQKEDFLICYLVACHHGRVRMTIQSRPTQQAPSDRVIDKSGDGLPIRRSRSAGPVRYALGVHEGDELPSIDLGDGLILEETKLSLACMELGGSLTVHAESDGSVTLEGDPSWTELSLELLAEYGPFRLAFLEALIRVADWQASAKNGINVEDGDV